MKQIHELHYLQNEILKKLALNPKLYFKDLMIENLESEHMNYHLKKLIQDGLVTKNETKYELTDSGKDYVNMMDDDIKALEKQPKTSILIKGERLNAEGVREYLICKRLKQPYFGKLGSIGGKVRFGETLYQAAERELFEETGLKAKTLSLKSIFHKIRHREDGEFIQDVIFYIFYATDFEGSFISQLPYQENLWITAKEFKNNKELDFFDSFSLEGYSEYAELPIKEDVNIATGF